MSIRIEGIIKNYGKQTVLDNINVTFNKNEITGLIGPNGAGKTTLMKIICGILKPDKGEIFINNIPFDRNSLDFKKNLGYLPENNPLYLDMYVIEFLKFTGTLYNIEKNYLKNRINEIIELTGITNERNKKIKQLSKGFRQRVGLAQVLIHDPEILILDEPTTGLDPNQIIEIRNLIEKVSKNKTIILSTHILQEVEAICDRVIILNKGKIVVDEYTSKLQKMVNRQTILIEIDNDNITENFFKFSNSISEVKKINENTFIIEGFDGIDIREEIFNYSVKNNLKILSMQTKNKRLEEVFRDFTSKIDDKN